ncbi:hypothetical protein [Parapedobacter soli]|uniref:hypothetical protein n=1 Tax=Parapedobacter soli TaxID=416955 RepID=UPI0021C5BA0E|nr:hypothetical protein [Parapedobacter soli]
MNRKEFLYKTTAGFTALMVAPSLWAFRTIEEGWKSFDFRPFRKGETAAPIIQVTPNDGYYLHTFYDICPWSPSGRYLALTKLPYQQRKPVWGDIAEICVVDLENQAIRTVYRTKAWSFQVGANVQWNHVADRYLYTNDIINGKPVCVRIDVNSGEAIAFSGAKYDVSPDGRSVVSPNLLNMNIHQYGYGVPDPPPGKPKPFMPEDRVHEGLWKTDLERDKTTLLVTIDQFFDAVAESDRKRYRDSIGYLFHSKFNRQGTRILQVFRAQVDSKGRNASLFTLDADGQALTQCLTAEKWNQRARLGGSGNHPNWHPDGERVIMNCIPTWLGYTDMLFCSFDYRGNQFTVLSEKHLGSGHPTMHPDSRYLLTDAYPKQTYVVPESGEIPIRLIDLKYDKEVTVCTMPTDVGGGSNQYLPEDRITGGSHHKLDPHPAWSRNYTQVCFNGAPGGQRQVFIADINALIS